MLIIILWGLSSSLHAQKKWYEYYKDGMEAQVRGEWQAAVEHFQAAIRLKDQESGKLRAYGTIFIEYYPHRELGISYYHLGDMVKARQELEYSISRSPSLRARIHLRRIEAGQPPAADAATVPSNANPPPPPVKDTKPATPPTAAPASSSLVGERLSMAVLPFSSKGIGRELGEIDLFDKLVTAFVNTKRFKVFERAQLQKILEEQQLGASGIIDISTAAQFGKGIGVDAVVVGSITQAGNSVSVDARLIDTETTAIITAKDAFSNSVNLQSLSNMINEMANKIKDDLPLVQGYVVQVEGSRVTLDIGYNQGVRKGIKCHVFREGAPLVHPVTGEVISRSIQEICEVQVSEVFDAYSVATITKPKNGDPMSRDRIITK